MKSTVGKAAEKRENYGVKLSKVGKSCVQSTPVASFLTPNKESKPSSTAPYHDYSRNTTGSIVDSHDLRALKENPFRVVSARKLAALVWELYQYKLPLSGMYHGGGPALPRLRRHGLHQKGDAEVHYPKLSTPEMPESSSNLRMRVPASPTMQHNRPTERFNNAIQPISPASYGSSMEIAPYNPAVTPSSSVELRGRTEEANLSLRTSTELLKVLNRIWSLEEQHVSNVALVKALKKELDRSRAQIKVLVRELQTDRQEINELMKQISEDNLARKNNDKAEAAVNSMREELGNERKLRRRSESLHRKLAHELHDVKVILGNVSKDLENERKSRLLLEDLCDEFAIGISKYGKELRALRQDSDRDWADSSNYDRLILDISESWLDERMQMKLDLGRGFEGSKSVVVKLSSEIEAFLKAKTSTSAANNNGNYKLTRESALRSSLESIPLNTAISAPQGEDDDNDDDEEDNDEDSASDSNCFELEKMGEALLKSQGKSYHDDETTKQNQPAMKKRIGSSDKATTGLSPSCLQVKFEEQMARAISHLEKSNQVKDEAAHSLTTEQAADLIESIPLKNREKGVVPKEEGGAYEREGNDMIENLNRTHYMLVQSEKLQPENKDYGAASSSSHWKSQPSPVRQWTDKFPSHGMSESSSSKLPQELKENTLKAKLLEARTRGQTSRSRLKSSRNF